MFTAAQKTLLYIIIVIFAENASFKSYGVICLPRMPLTSYFEATKYGCQRNPRNVGMTLLFAVLTKNDSFRSYCTFVYLLRVHILNINTCTYTTSAHGHELSVCVRADTDNLILIFASYYHASWPWPARPPTHPHTDTHTHRHNTPTHPPMQFLLLISLLLHALISR